MVQARITHPRDMFRENFLDRVWLVVAPTSDREMNRLIGPVAAVRRLFVTVVDDATLLSFHMPAVVDRRRFFSCLSPR